MLQIQDRRIAGVKIFLATLMTALLVCGCSTAPKAEDQVTFLSDAATATRWFENHVYGLREQMDKSAAYIVYPAVGQWGIVFTGGTYGRGMLNRADGSQIGWAALNTGSIGLQVGVRGFKMLVLFEDEATLGRFMQNKLSGSVSGVALVAETGTSGKASFEDGVAIYQGASTGLMAGVDIGLNYMRYKPLSDE